MYESVYNTSVVLSHHLLNPLPAKFSQCLCNMLPVPETGNNSGTEVNALLEPSLLRRRTTPLTLIPTQYQCGVERYTQLTFARVKDE